MLESGTGECHGMPMDMSPSMGHVELRSHYFMLVTSWNPNRISRNGHREQKDTENSQSIPSSLRSEAGWPFSSPQVLSRSQQEIRITPGPPTGGSEAVCATCACGKSGVLHGWVCLPLFQYLTQNIRQWGWNSRKKEWIDHEFNEFNVESTTTGTGCNHPSCSSPAPHARHR